MTVKVTMANGGSDSVDFINATGTTLAQVKAYDDGSSNGHLELYTTASGTASEKVRVTSAGNVGIGTSSPATKLAVAGGMAGTAGLNVSGGGWGVLPYVANSFVVDNNAGQTRFFATGADATTDGSFLFYTSQTDGGANERMRIDSSGNLLVGTTAIPTGSTNSAALAPVGYGIPIVSSRSTTSAAEQARFYNPNGQVGSIQTNGSATSYVTSSDYRLKENIAPMTGALSKVALLKPCTYKWKVDGSEGQGFIAHELAEVEVGCVTGEKDAVETYTDEDGIEQTRPVYQGIDTSFLVATLTAAIQELKAIVDTQAARIEALENPQ